MLDGSEMVWSQPAPSFTPACFADCAAVVCMFSDVPPMVDHRFIASKDTKALEIYWTDALDPLDIVREDTGGTL